MAIYILTKIIYLNSNNNILALYERGRQTSQFRQHIINKLAILSELSY